IRGENGAGKTTIAEAITWGLFGVDLAGSNRVDRLMHPETGGMMVSVRFIGPDGQEHRVTRMRRYRGGDLLVDGRKATQADIEQVVGPSRYWLPVFWPQTVGTWTDSQAREFFGWLLRRVEPEAVLEALGPGYAPALAGLRLVNPEEDARAVRREIQEAERRLEQLRGRLEALREQAAKEPPAVTEPDHAEALARLEAELAALEAPDTSALEAQIRALQGVVAEARAEMASLQAAMEDPEEIQGVCPSCGQNLPPERLAAVRKAMEARNAERRAKVQEAIRRGREANRQLKLLQQQLEALQRSANGERRKALAAEIDALRQRQQVHRLQVELRERILAEREAARERVREAEEAIAEMEAQIGRLRQQLDALRAYIYKHAELQAGQLAEHLRRVSVQLHEIVKTTGELKPVFRLRYDDLPYPVLSTSEKIRAGLEIASLVNRLTGVDYPVFVDNAESLTHFERPEASQVFVARVAAGEPLTVRPMEGVLQHG
ncbi:MAG: hypothetical protein DIU71_19090, partial [Proteobacteria bacterium]